HDRVLQDLKVWQGEIHLADAMRTTDDHKPSTGQDIPRSFKRRFTQVWSAARHILSIRGLLQWVGLWKGLVAAAISAGLTLGGYIEHLAAATRPFHKPTHCNKPRMDRICRAAD